MGSAQTGTGKTAAFALPILTKLEKHGAMRVLVLEPTRELAAQVETAFRDFARFMDMKIGLVHGGVGYGKQRADARRRARMCSSRRPAGCSISWKTARSSSNTIQYLVLDEVDRMLDMGFLPQVRRIVDKVPKAAADAFLLRDACRPRSRR